MINELPMDDDGLSLLSLPIELLCAIVRLLDPIGLISLSQSSRIFRALIQPSKEDFVQRLLALELDPHLGGIVRFRSSDNNLTPPWDDAEAWKAIRFACVGCMKLLPHTRFSNQNLLQLRRRKPPSGSREADRITDWEPLACEDAKARGLRIQERARREKEDRAAVHFEVERGTEVGIGADVRTEHFTLYHVRCPGCAVWQELGAFRVGLAYAHATPSLMLEKRREKLRGEEDVSDTSLSEEDVFDTPLGEEDVSDPPLGEEDVSDPPPGEEDVFEPPLGEEYGPDALLCNSCVLAQHGRARLGEELTAFATTLVDTDYARGVYRLHFGWRLLEETLRESQRKTKKHHFSAGFHEIIAGLPWVAAENIANEQKTLDLDHCDPDDLRRRIVRLRVLVKTELTEERRKEFLRNPWFRSWLEHYEKNETWVVALEEVRSNGPDVLADFVLEKDPYRVI
ncbi:hypothetical protein B0H19DRAFT_1196927 [Mycena capillaripes]|nr:hypothetical protein B0H19DRAFT_1196927 [Mycena capillaripes]